MTHNNIRNITVNAQSEIVYGQPMSTKLQPIQPLRGVVPSPQVVQGQMRPTVINGNVRPVYG